MTQYDYREAVYDDVRNYIDENCSEPDFEDLDALRERLYDEMFVADEVTGNASGSYTFSTWRAEENLCHNWDLLMEAFSEFGDRIEFLEKGAEFCDVSIRCYLLGEILDSVLDDIASERED